MLHRGLLYTPWAIKTFRFVFFCTPAFFSWLIFLFFVAVETGMNTLQLTESLMTSKICHITRHKTLFRRVTLLS